MSAPFYCWSPINLVQKITALERQDKFWSVSINIETLSCRYDWLRKTCRMLVLVVGVFFFSCLSNIILLILLIDSLLQWISTYPPKKHHHTNVTEYSDGTTGRWGDKIFLSIFDASIFALKINSLIVLNVNFIISTKVVLNAFE